MGGSMHLRIWAAALTAGLLAISSNVAAADEAKPRSIEFNRDVRPILSDTCFVCHGPDSSTRKAKLRLDQEKSVLADRGGYQIIVPGKPAESELYRRITEENVRERMPPAGHPRQLNKGQMDLL